MLKSSHLFFISLILLAISGCGVKEKTSATSYVKSALALETSCQINEEKRTFSNSIAFPEFYQKVDKLITDYNVQKGQELIGLNNYFMVEGTHFKTPLLLSEERLKRRMAHIKSKLQNIFQADIMNLTTLDPMIVEANRVELTTQLQKLGVLKESINRWEAQQCELESLSDKKDLDIRGLLKYRDDQNSFLELCTQVRSQSNCNAEFRLFKRQGKVEEFINHYKAKIEEREKTYFRRNKRIHLSCKKSEELDKNIITLNIHIDKGTKKIVTDLNKMKLMAQTKWSNDKNLLKINFKENKNLKAKLKLTDRFVSHVQTSNQGRVLFLSKNMSRFQRPYIFAHEVGHLLGFPDCYVEFFDKEKKEIIYYSLEKEKKVGSRKNIMCGLHANAKAPDHYINQMAVDFCKN